MVAAAADDEDIIILAETGSGVRLALGRDGAETVRLSKLIQKWISQK